MTPTQANELLEKTEFLKEIEKLIADKLLAFVNTKEYEYEERENIYKSVKAMEQLRDHFESLALTDKIKKSKFFIA
jgi:hypothetical protein|tara:strand:+ start:3710 stop:3937 length:228 start_codon:yes stop_codon:yes gene_type:complete